MSWQIAHEVLYTGACLAINFRMRGVVVLVHRECVELLFWCTVNAWSRCFGALCVRVRVYLSIIRSGDLCKL